MGSDSFNYLNNIQETWFLVNVVDNNYISGDITAFMLEFIAQNKEAIQKLAP